MMVRLRDVIVTTAALSMAGVGHAAAQGYPDHVIELVVPSTPGASADLLGRVVADGMSTALGQRMIVLNKGGAGGILGTTSAAQAKPDGYTLLHTAASAFTSLPLTDKTSYTYKSFDPICQTFKNDQVIVARPGTYKNIADILAASKAKPGGLNYGTPGAGTIPHLAVAQLSQITRVEFNNVPFRGPAETIQMTAAGQIDFAVAPLTAAAGSNLAMPALFAQQRNPSIPDVPTVKEQGYDVAPLSIGGMLAPAGLPPDVKKRLDDACQTAMKTEAFQRVAKNTFQPADFMGDSARFKANIDMDVEEKRKLLTALGLAKN